MAGAVLCSHLRWRKIADAGTYHVVCQCLTCGKRDTFTAGAWRYYCEKIAPERGIGK